MVQARIVNDTTNIDVHGEQTQTTVNVVSESAPKTVRVVGVMDHNELRGRNNPNQHSIDSITGLTEALQEVSDKSFIFEQATASDTWVIVHNLNKRPSVTIVDSSGTVFYPAVHYDSDNQCTITMNGATTGFAYLN